MLGKSFSAKQTFKVATQPKVIYRFSVIPLNR